MKRIFRIALRDFVAVVTTIAFAVGWLFLPIIFAAMFILVPSFVDDRNFQIEGEYAIVDPTGFVFREMKAALDSDVVAERWLEDIRQDFGQVSDLFRFITGVTRGEFIDELPELAPNVRLIALSADTDIEAKKAWLNEKSEGLRHTALIVIHKNAVEVSSGIESQFGTYDLYISSGLDDRDLNFIHSNIRMAIVNARISAQSLERDQIQSIILVPRQRATIIGFDGEQQITDKFTFILPLVFMGLMFLGVVVGGQTMLTSTIEEKSSRTIEILLSAVSPMELMAGKLIAGVAVSLVTMSLYILIGLMLLSSFSLSNLFDPWLILYLLIFFLIGFFVVGALMLAVGSAVNNMNEAGILLAPLTIITMVPLIIWPVMSRNPDSLLSIVVSHLPPINSFGMLVRMASTQPPPWWEVWLSIGVGVGSVVGAIWVAAKVFKIGVLMYGKPPNLKTLMEWVRMA